MGLHVGCRALFVRPPGASSTKRCVAATTSEGGPLIDHALVAAMNVGAAGVADLDKDVACCQMRFLLRAAYSLTYAAAAARGSPTLVLTLVGGGVFGNPIIDVACAIASAHAEWTTRVPLLKRVMIPLFPIGADASPIVAALTAAGVPPGHVRVVRHRPV